MTDLLSIPFEQLYIDDTYNEWYSKFHSEYQGEFALFDAKTFIRVIPLSKGPIKYAEIGSYRGGSAIGMLRTYCSYPGSEVHCIDPWIDYTEYPEYIGKQESNYEHFIKNISKYGDLSKVYIHRGFSNTVVSKFTDETFDMFFVDGNHETPNVLEDAILAYRKVKKGGWLIFDDFSPAVPGTMKAIQLFLEAYKEKFSNIQLTIHGHVFCKKKDA